jgi:hypothetical protein
MPSAKSAPLTAALLTRAEFGHRLSADRRRAYWAIGIGCTSLVLLFVGMAFGGEYMNRTGVPVGSPDRIWPLFAMFPVPSALLIGGIWWAERKSETKCPACRQSLFTAHDPYLAMVTGRCPKCAVPMFADDVHDFDVQPTNRRPQRSVRGTLHDVAELARQFRPAIPWAIAGAVLLGLGLKAKALLETEYYTSLLGDVWTAFFEPLTIVPGVLVGSLGLWASVRALDMKAESCPHCGGRIGGWARNTGCCSSCGRQFVDDAFPGMQPRDAVATSLWSIDEYRTAAKDRHSHLWIGCFIGAGWAIAFITPWFLLRDRYLPSPVMTGFDFIAWFGIVLQILAPLWWHRRLARDLQCPECRHELLHFYPLVVSSQRCCHCGCQVLKPPVPQSAA